MNVFFLCPAGFFGAVLAATILSALPGSPSVAPSAVPPADSLRILFWNVENFFDFRNDSLSVSDAEFSAAGERHWGRKRFYAKCNAVAKTVLWARAPDIVAFAEVENAFVLRRLVQATPLVKMEYRPVHYDSPDPRGIDVALLYRSDRLDLLESRPFHVFDSSQSAAGADTLLRTRDILFCRFRDRRTEGTFALLVCHLPSKYGGITASSPRRAAAVRRLRALADSLSPLIVCGDFNDTPDNEVFRQLEPALVNLAAPLHARGEGTLRYAGKWELIDMFWASPEWNGAAGEGPGRQSVAPPRMEILRPPFLLTRDSAHGGIKPLRTYSGPRHLGGVSDHLPVLLTMPPP